MEAKVATSEAMNPFVLVLLIAVRFVKLPNVEVSVSVKKFLMVPVAA